MLEALRLIERRPQSGIYVRPAVSEPSLEALLLQESLDLRSSTRNYEQAQEARIIHEVEAVRLAATRRSADDLAALQSIIDRSRLHLARGAISPTTMRPFSGPDRSRILLRIGKSLYLMTRSIRCSDFEAAGSGPQSITDHVRILKAVAQRDAAQAAKLVKRHYAVSSLRWRTAFDAGH